jgi:hypothetical protein
VSFTLSAPSFDSKIISAVTMGYSDTMRQLNMGPPTGVIAVSISCADVPRKKFSAIMMYGPARPFIVKLVWAFDLGTILYWPFKLGDDAEPLKAFASRSLRACVALGARGGIWETRVAEGLFKA